MEVEAVEGVGVRATQKKMMSGPVTRVLVG
jgi:hypothetical protein